MALLIHRVKDAPMHRLEAVTRVRQRSRHDHAHRVIEVTALHLLGDGNGAHIGGGCIPRFGRFSVGQDDVPAWNFCRDFLADSGWRRYPKWPAIPENILI